MNIKEMLEAFTGGLGHECGDLSGSAISAREQISNLLAAFRDDFVARVDGLDRAISEVLDGHAAKATRLAERARNGELVMPSSSVTMPVDTETLMEGEEVKEMAAKLRPVPKRAA
jgi:hypothetical protein